MSKETSTPTSNGSTQQPEAPTPPTAQDVAKATGEIVKILLPLPPAFQLRALGAAATTLGVDKESRSRTNNTTTQQRSNNNGSQQRSGSGGQR